jgi:lipoprotein
MMKKVILFSILAIILVSCGGVAKQFVNYTHGELLPEGKSRIYVMFKTSKILPMLSLFCNEKLIGTIDRRGYLAFDVPAGAEYTLYATTGEREGYTWNGTAGDEHFRIKAKEGKTYYIKLSFQMGTFVGKYNFEYLDKTEGEKKLKKYSQPRLNYAE